MEKKVMFPPGFDVDAFIEKSRNPPLVKIGIDSMGRPILSSPSIMTQYAEKYGVDALVKAKELRDAIADLGKRKK